MGQQHIKLYSNEERNGSTTYKNYIVMRKGMGQQQQLYSNEERNNNIYSIVMRKGMGQQHIQTI